ncbi:carbohydrate-binding module family 1 protein [Cylindrobasidium torrendii FP15055 ss-10]|uniref:Glucanase n=1 Tax=Cylindrobasidium torrendii FP15055 ss-10 TaxID=1314674 RepID=A0A0D7B3Q8_9AGAR|nr:carbohydrate-binding module family 1 protein [Cylindrobasidium torrendii FP15055 ss-10]
MQLTPTFLALSLAISSAFAAPSSLHQRALCSSAVKITQSENPFATRKLHANAKYRAEVEAAAAAITDASLKTKALQIADIGSFLWLDTISTIPTFEGYLNQTDCSEIFGVVIYDLPGRDCAAKASNGELPTGSLARYKTEYIDPIAKIIKANPNIAIAAVIEPDSLPNLVTNDDLATCQNAASEYRDGVAYALKTLNLPNVAMYVDAGHGGWLGWNDNLAPGAAELASAYKAAGSPAGVHGVSSNVAGWNAWIKNPGEFENTPDGKYNKAQDEERYVENFGAALATAGMPNHFIVDTGRNAVQGLRLEWGDWCNVNGAGFGRRPTAETGNALADAFVWVKPGGESDGTSDSSATRYDSFCGKEDAFKPSPEAGAWHQKYFEMLLKNANLDGTGTPTSSVPPTGTATSSSAPSSTTSSSAGTAAHYGQCGGTGWTGPTKCESPYTCTVVSAPYYSQCL